MANVDEPHYNNLSEAITLGAKGLKEKIQAYRNEDDNTVTSNMGTIDTMIRSKFKDAVQGMEGVQNSEAILGLTEAGYLLASKYYSDGMSTNAAASKAYEDLFGKSYNTVKVDGSSFIVPKEVGGVTIDLGNVKGHADRGNTRHLTSTLLKKGWDVAVGDMDPAFAKYFKDAGGTKNTLGEKGIWEYSPAANGIILFGDFGVDGKVPIPMIDSKGKKTFIRQDFLTMERNPVWTTSLGRSVAGSIDAVSGNLAKLGKKVSDEINPLRTGSSFDRRVKEDQAKTREIILNAFDKAKKERLVKEYRFEDGTVENRPVYVGGERIN
jgi:hypothetical protein